MKHLLVPTDFSEYAGYATQFAFLLAKKMDAKITFAHLVSTPIEWSALDFVSPSSAEITDEDKLSVFPELQKYIQDIKAKAQSIEDEAAKYGITSKFEIIYNKDNADIPDIAKDKSVDLIVMGSHGSAGIKAFIGSNTQKVVRLSKTPVITIKDKVEALGIKKIVFASDFEFRSSLAALESVEQFASLIGAEVHLLFVNTPSHFIDSRTIKSRLGDFMSHFPNKKYNYHVYSHYSVDEGILNFVEDNNFDMISIATNGFSGLRGLLHESIAENIINYIPKPTFSLNLK